MDSITSSPVVLGILGCVVLLIGVIAAVVARYKVAGPNEAFVITGKGGGDPASAEDQKVVLGGGVFVVPVVKELHTMDLSSRRITLTVHKAMTNEGIRLNLEAVAIIKVGGTEEAVRAAAQRFLTQQDQIKVFTTDVLSGALRSIVGELNVYQITNERTEFSNRVRHVVEETLTAQGLTLDTLEIQDVTDDGTYLADLARPQAAATRRAAEIAEAEAKRESEQAQLKADEEIAIAQRQLALRQAEIKAETDRAAADAAASGPLAEAAKRQEILAEQEKVAQRQASLTERELETSVRKPADAERYRVEQEAESRRVAAISKAEGDKAAKIALAEADKAARIAGAEAAAVEVERLGSAEKASRTALADALQREGEAEAAAIAAKGAAEAESMQAKADAYANYNDAAILDLVSQMLPAMAREISAPMGNIDKLTVISSDGANQLPKNVADNLVQLLSRVSDTTGIDVASLMSGVAGKATGQVGRRAALPAEEDVAAQ